MAVKVQQEFCWWQTTLKHIQGTPQCLWVSQKGHLSFRGVLMAMCYEDSSPLGADSPLSQWGQEVNPLLIFSFSSVSMQPQHYSIGILHSVWNWVCFFSTVCLILLMLSSIEEFYRFLLAFLDFVSIQGFIRFFSHSVLGLHLFFSPNFL
jgi:hypothetical protein